MRSILFASALLLSACKTAHLGPDTNVAYREAFAAQRESEPERTPTFGADDAHRTNAARRGEQTKAAPPAAGAALLPITPMSSGGASGAWPGAKGNISLEAK